jgi:hypothetical protein
MNQNTVCTVRACLSVVSETSNATCKVTILLPLDDPENGLGETDGMVMMYSVLGD